MRLFYFYPNLYCILAVLLVLACKAGEAEEKTVNPNASSAEVKDYRIPPPMHQTDMEIEGCAQRNEMDTRSSLHKTRPFP